MSTLSVGYGSYRCSELDPERYVTVRPVAKCFKCGDELYNRNHHTLYGEPLCYGCWEEIASIEFLLKFAQHERIRPRFFKYLQECVDEGATESIKQLLDYFVDDYLPDEFKGFCFDGTVSNVA